MLLTFIYNEELVVFVRKRNTQNKDGKFKETKKRKLYVIDNYGLSNNIDTL